MSRGRHAGRRPVPARHQRTGRGSSLTGWSAHAAIVAMTPVTTPHTPCKCHHAPTSDLRSA
uniref:hypothetical protein n=1 Tax=Herbidospora sakaeratensis TaxID=564415 RepID=UPI000781A97F|nr:hypothetical protein [Herbidospora sakaeratensis]